MSLSNDDPLMIAPMPPSIASLDIWGELGIGALWDMIVVDSVDVLLCEGSSPLGPPSVTSTTLLTSLAFLRPHCGGCPRSPGFSTATKLALTLLTGLLFPETAELLGDRPLLGGDVEWSRFLFSNIARRFRTPPALLADITAS